MKSQPFFGAVLAGFALVGLACAGERDYQDFVCLGEKGPVWIRFHVQLDGKPLLDAWEDFMGKLFAHLDKNGDGVLSKDEALRVPPAQVLFNNVPNFVGRRPDAPQTLDKDRDGRITRAELADWYRAIGAAPLQMQVVPVQNLLADRAVGSPNQLLSADDLNEKLFSLLDTDKDSKLSREELARAPEVLHKIDLNEDETVNVEELTENIGSGEGRFVPASSSMRNGPAKRAPFTPVESGEANKDSAPRPPDLEFRIRFDEQTARRSGVELVPSKGWPSALAKSVRSSFSGALVLELGSTRIELDRGEPSAQPRIELPRLHRQYRAQFLRSDRDSNGYLDDREAMQTPLFRSAFRLMDRDGDGKLFEKEVIAYLNELKELQEAAVRSCASLVVRDQGRGLFDLVDVNNDGRLGVRELRQMTKLVDQLDRDGDRQIHRDEIPHRYRVDVRRGPALSNLSIAPVVVVRQMARNNQADMPQDRGPLWFRKMDRNRDGEISLREFLASEEIFRQIDQDGDGFISLEEALCADRIFRKEKERKP